MNERKWAIGDWLELRGQRFLVYRVDEQTKTFWAIPKTGGQQEIFCDFDDCDVKWLDGCDSWEWQEPKLIEPPEGYRVLEDGEVYARKITPQVRPMTRDEFLAAWKQRGFCPLIDPDNDYDFFERIIVDDCQDDQEFIQLMYAGWLGMDELAKFRFAFDKTFLTVEE